MTGNRRSTCLHVSTEPPSTRLETRSRWQKDVWTTDPWFNDSNQKADEYLIQEVIVCGRIINNMGSPRKSPHLYIISKGNTSTIVRSYPLFKALKDWMTTSSLSLPSDMGARYTHLPAPNNVRRVSLSLVVVFVAAKPPRIFAPKELPCTVFVSTSQNFLSYS